MNAPVLPSRIEAKIVRKGGCWQWVAGKHSDGYGVVRWEGESRLAHRVVYSILVGPIPEGMTLDHTCRNRACVNPEHLDVVTLAENNERGFSPSAQNKRKDRCPRGHKYNRRNPNTGRRYCQTCQSQDQRSRRLAQRA